ncbi:glutamine synthetase, beta-Grasp domain protein [Francisella philomiragia subsp. philomiragia ATCC 25015]|uniref:glutamine synthetase beta-grasp domain-containing protein n=1 Tax=Francisella philomiragia TaxID=28110 RepID=UPI0001AF7685|nr:glutamine synthetase beta-grasp domain-containing protein [Francisella philomiragia]AJI74433.1 glutamine synthetase, beta-Grasp domain protein [Francisella philomiragia subsp. philomiragia ATCC 25015]EET20434.1 glutamine synthetase [Francisella philomiragia subsp. philomiragia ATCC 25015]MBK2237478.1 glutamine synthetase beta-grasp domain-containing protein [Francisella philomiragia]
MKVVTAEYIWIDGSDPVPGLRSKGRVLPFKDFETADDFPEWSFDGSSTNQATGDNSDCILKPINFVIDPLRECGYLVMCEVYNPDGETPHATNNRAKLRALLASADCQDMWAGFEQEYTMFKDGRPLGWPTTGFPGPQGPYYCSAGNSKTYGRDLVEAHMQACLDAGILFYGINAEVMPGQWEFQIGYRGVEGEDAGILNISDHTHLARWLLERLGEEYGIDISFDNKPIKGDWNGAGLHTNFSTSKTRNPETGRDAIKKICASLEKNHKKDILNYGYNLHERLTGKLETSDMNTFSVGDADRGCSIRIPRPVALKGYGYLEDRRPGANADPYVVAMALANAAIN